MNRIQKETTEDISNAGLQIWLGDREKNLSNCWGIRGERSNKELLRKRPLSGNWRFDTKSIQFGKEKFDFSLKLKLVFSYFTNNSIVMIRLTKIRTKKKKKTDFPWLIPNDMLKHIYIHTYRRIRERCSHMHA